MRNKLLFFGTVFVLLVIYPVIELIQIHKYEETVDNNLYKKLALMEESKEQYEQGVLFSSNRSNEPKGELVWDTLKVRLNSEDINTKDDAGYNTGISYDVIETQIKNSGEWKNLIRKEKGFCSTALVFNNQLLCFGYDSGDRVLNSINPNGQFSTKKLISTPNSMSDYVLIDNQTLYFIFTDDRFVWSLPILGDAPHEIGTQFLMAGELNLDTLAFKEHVIGYANVKFFKGGYSMTTLLPQVKQPESQANK